MYLSSGDVDSVNTEAEVQPADEEHDEALEATVTLMLCDENLDQVIWSNCCDDKANIVKIRKVRNEGIGCRGSCPLGPLYPVAKVDYL